MVSLLHYPKKSLQKLSQQRKVILSSASEANQNHCYLATSSCYLPSNHTKSMSHISYTPLIMWLDYTTVRWFKSSVQEIIETLDKPLLLEWSMIPLLEATSTAKWPLELWKPSSDSSSISSSKHLKVVYDVLFHGKDIVTTVYSIVVGTVENKISTRHQLSH